MRTCDVSVIIPNYNRTTSLRRAILSVSKQTILPKEVLVIDDGSDEDTVEYVRDVATEFARFFPVELIIIDSNRGANYCRNRGIDSARCNYLAFLDSDDMWFPEKLEKQIACIEKAKLADARPVLSATGRYRVSSQGKIVARQYGVMKFTSYNIRRSNFIGTLSSVIVEKCAARRIDGFDETLRACQDWDFFIRSAALIQYVGVSDPLCVYVDHNEVRISSGNRKRLAALLSIYRRHIRGSIATADEAGFFRVIAEDLQEAGRDRWSRYFYAKHLMMKYVDKASLPKMLEAAIAAIYSAALPKSLKERRYRGYRRGLARKMLNPSFRNEVLLHQESIYLLMSSEC